MPNRDEERRQHIFLNLDGTSEPFTSPQSGPRGRRIPERAREQHGRSLLQRLQAVENRMQQLQELRQDWGFEARDFVYLEFQAEREFALKLESLEDLRAGIELLAVNVRDGVMYATVLVPSGRLGRFVRKVEDYLEKDRKSGRPANEELVAGIAGIREAALESLWTDDRDEFPQDDELCWWEVWLRTKPNPTDVLDRFRLLTDQLEGVSLGDRILSFPERTVVLVRARRSNLLLSLEVLDVVAELRQPKLTAADFLDLEAEAQAEWQASLLQRLEAPAQDSPAITLLDTGINAGHPLLAPLVDPTDVMTCNAIWGTADHHGHGTEMAGVAGYGDLQYALEAGGPVQLSHALESVKILPPNDQNAPELYGSLTIEAVARAETNRPDRSRAICMAVTATDSRDAGRPSSWSAAVDSICFNDGWDTRVFVVSAGNCRIDTAAEYPNASLQAGLHDPAQAWNAISVGAFTNKTEVDLERFPGHQAIAPQGDMSPYTSSSLSWDDQWPIKPDVVFEGGNLAAEPAAGVAVHVDSLAVLTTNSDPALRPFGWTAETSAATAQAGYFAGAVLSEYPRFWPETVRGLMIHSADWTAAMKERFGPDKRSLLRSCGYGVPSLARARWSASNALTMIQQDEIQPFVLDGSNVRTNEMVLYELPWPTEELLGLQNTPVELRVTLSYYVEANPSRTYQIGSSVRRHQYRSAGLRFDTKTATESIDDFRRRINRAAREDAVIGRSAADKWALGRNLRAKGSVHSDSWYGTAAELAEKRYIAVYPVSGWWRYNKGLESYEKQLRFSLIVSIEVPDVDVDLYTDITNQIELPIET